MLDELTKDWPHAIVTLTDANGRPTMRRPAAFVFDAKDGFAWVEPQYIDPMGASSPALHIIRATLRREGQNAARFTSPDGLQGYIEIYEDDATDLVGTGLERFKEWLQEQKKTAAEERAAVRKMIASDLAGETDEN